MTATKRRQPIVFAIACALVLIGGSLKASAADLGELWNPRVTETILGVGGDFRLVRIEFFIDGMRDGNRPIDVCGHFKHQNENGTEFEVTDCDPIRVISDNGRGDFRVLFEAPMEWGGVRVTRTWADIKIRIPSVADGAWSDRTQTQELEWPNWP